jgi:hypothetical protein
MMTGKSGMPFGAYGQYPEGGGMVGSANKVYGSPTAGQPQQQQDTSGYSALGKGLKAYLANSTPAASGSAPIGAGAGQQSITALSNAPTVMGGTPATANLGATGGGASSWLSAAGPWAALAAAIVANESKQRHDNNRGNSGWEQAGDIVTGKVLERDADRYLAHNTAGNIGRRVLMMGTPSGVVRNTKDLGKWLKGLF